MLQKSQSQKENLSIFKLLNILNFIEFSSNFLKHHCLKYAKI